MAIHIEFTDESGIEHPDCYVKITEAYQDYSDTPRLSVICGFYHSKALRDLGKPAFMRKSYSQEDFEVSINVSDADDIRNACYGWLMANREEFSEGTVI